MRLVSVAPSGSAKGSKSIIRLVPPEEKKGRLMPVFGMVLVTTAMFSTACNATCTTKPTTSSAAVVQKAMP